MKIKSNIFIKVLSVILLLCAWIPFIVGLFMLKYPTVRNAYTAIWLIFVLSIPILILVLCWKDKAKIISVVLSVIYIFIYIFPLSIYLNSNNIYYVMPLISKTESNSNYNDFDTLPQFTDTISYEEIQSFFPKSISDDAEYEYSYDPGHDALKISLKMKVSSEEISNSINKIEWNPTIINQENCIYYYNSIWPYTHKQICVYDSGEVEYLLLVSIVSNKAVYDSSFYSPIESVI